MLREEEFIDIVMQNKEYLYRMAYIYTKNEHDALEIVDETVYKAYLSYKKLREKEYFKTWITRILINCAIDYINKRKRILNHESLFLPEKNGEFEKIDLYDGLNKLNEPQRSIIILKYFYQYTIREISEMLNISESVVKNNFHKALNFLRINLKED